MSGRSRLAVLALILLAVLAAEVLLAFAGSACATDLPSRPCPQAATNRAVVVALVGLAAALLVAPFAFLAEFALRGRSVERGSWTRALRRGLLLGLAVSAFAGLRLAGALSVPAALFVLVMLAMVEGFAVRVVDAP